MSQENLNENGPPLEISGTTGTAPPNPPAANKWLPGEVADSTEQTVQVAAGSPQAGVQGATSTSGTGAQDTKSKKKPPTRPQGQSVQMDTADEAEDQRKPPRKRNPSLQTLVATLIQHIDQRTDHLKATWPAPRNNPDNGISRQFTLLF